MARRFQCTVDALVHKCFKHESFKLTTSTCKKANSFIPFIDYLFSHKSSVCIYRAFPSLENTFIFHYGSSQDNECSFPCSTVGPCFFLSYRSDFAFLILKYSHGRLFTPPTSAGRGPSLCVSLCRAPHAQVCSLFPQTTQTLLHPTPPWVLLCFFHRVSLYPQVRVPSSLFSCKKS